MTKLIDNHCHILFPENIDITVSQGEELIKKLGIDKLAMLSWPYIHQPDQDLDVLENLKVLYFKERMSIPVYAYMGFYEYSDDGKENAAFMKRMIDMGFDGWKSSEMHPRMYKMLGKGLNDPAFAETFEYVEKEGIPIVCHLGDPKEHWNPDEVSEWCRENGRWYDETFPTLQQLYDEMDEVLERYPKLKIAMAHFYFLSIHYEKAVQLMEDYENFYMDLTPGTEMFKNFSKNSVLWREYFAKYSKKIIMGSDLYPAGYGVERHNLVRKFLERSEPFYEKIWDQTYVPIHLPNEMLKDIYVNNAERFSSVNPKPVNRKMAYDYCMEIAEKYGDTLTDIGKENLKIMTEYWRDEK